MHAWRCPRECAGPAAELPLYIQCSTSSFMQGGVRTCIRWGFCLLPSTTWGQGRQPSSSPAVSVSASSAPVTSSSRDLRAAARRLC